MIFDIEHETLPRESLEKLQLKRLQNLCERLYANVPFYKDAFREKQVSPSDIRSLQDVSSLPFTEKQDLRDQYPYGMFAVPKNMIVRLHASSGTTGKATVVGYTKRDIETWGKLMARCLGAAGVTQNDFIHNAYGYGLFTGGLGMHYGVETLGATVIPVSGGSTKRQVYLLNDFKASVLACTPSYALYLYDVALDEGIDIDALALRVGIFGAEPWTEEMRANIESKLKIDALNIYGLSEIMGPGVAQECIEAKSGMHIFEDHFLPEIIDPSTGETLAPGQVGELVLSTLTKEGIPLLRYRTKDITSLQYEPCVCGRTHVRMGRILGRSDDMLIIRGVNVYPQQIESLLVQEKGISSHYEIEVKKEGNLDQLEIRVEFTEDMLGSDEVSFVQHFERNLQKNIKDFLNISAKVRLVQPRSLRRFEGKALRVIDSR